MFILLLGWSTLSCSRRTEIWSAASVSTVSDMVRLHRNQVRLPNTQLLLESSEMKQCDMCLAFLVTLLHQTCYASAPAIAMSWWHYVFMFPILVNKIYLLPWDHFFKFDTNFSWTDLILLVKGQGHCGLTKHVGSLKHNIIINWWFSVNVGFMWSFQESGFSWIISYSNICLSVTWAVMKNSSHLRCLFACVRRSREAQKSSAGSGAGEN